MDKKTSETFEVVPLLNVSESRGVLFTVPDETPHVTSAYALFRGVNKSRVGPNDNVLGVGGRSVSEDPRVSLTESTRQSFQENR